MFWPLQRRCVPSRKTATWSLYYMAACPVPADPTIVWGTDVPVAGLEDYLRRVNARSEVIVSAAHVLIRAVGRCLVDHPEFNRRVMRRKLFEFRNVNVLMPVLGGRGGPEPCLFCDVDRKSLAEIARETWQHARELAKGTSRWQQDERVFRGLPGLLRGLLFRHFLWECNTLNFPAAPWSHRSLCAGTMINYLGFRGAPPLRSFKPSRFPNDSCTLNVTMGPSEPGERGPTAPLFVRADHRVVDAYQLGRFVADLRRYLAEPEIMDEDAEVSPASGDKFPNSSLAPFVPAVPAEQLSAISN